MISQTQHNLLDFSSDAWLTFEQLYMEQGKHTGIAVAPWILSTQPMFYSVYFLLVETAIHDHITNMCKFCYWLSGFDPGYNS